MKQRTPREPGYVDFCDACNDFRVLWPIGAGESQSEIFACPDCLQRIREESVAVALK